MAITVELKITPIDVVRKEVSVVATYTDSEDPTNPKVVSVSSALIATSEQKSGLLDAIDAHYKALLTKETAIAEFLGDLETAGATILEARI